MTGFDDLIAPLSIQSFLDDYWETQPLHVARANNYHQPLISIAGIEELLSNRRLYFPDVQLVRADLTIEPTDYTTENNQILPLRLLQHHCTGATILIAHAQFHFNALNTLCRQLRQQLGIDCQTNLYLSPVAAQGFKPHYDSHDVLILQVSGEKIFRFYAGGPSLPEERHRFDSQRDPIGEKTQEICLCEGDTLYLPRGYLHDAVAAGDEPSLHITVGLFAPTLADVVDEAINLKRNHRAQWRNSLLHLSAQTENQGVDTTLTEALHQISQDDMQAARTPF